MNIVYAMPRPGEPERDLTEAERLKADDLLNSMRRRLDAMETLLCSPTADLQAFEERRVEHENFAEELQAVIWAAWGEDES